jgi:exopolyphosphatase/guanosine-5'-triphosphate,3'-diphosphate pyrophosphatase
MLKRVAAVDCGTNSIRLLVADADRQARSLTDVIRLMEIVRLGEGVDRTGRLSAAALERTLRALRGYAEVIKDTGAVAVRMVATSATRDAENAVEFSARVKEVLGVAPEVLTGDEEARLSFTGATAELGGSGSAEGVGPGPGAPYLVADIGGGSTEFVLGGPPSPLSSRAGSAGPAEIVADRSVNIGCVRMTERHLHSDPPTQEEIAAASADIDAALRAVAADVPVGQARTLIGLAGSVTTVAGIALRLPAYDATRIHHARISAAQVHAVTQRLLAQTRAERTVIGVMHPGRVDVIGAGALVLDRIMTRFGFEEVLVSEHDILDGIAWSLT